MSIVICLKTPSLPVAITRSLLSRAPITLLITSVYLFKNGLSVNVNVEKFGKNKTKVRIVFSQKVLQNADGYSYVKSAPTRILKVYDPKVYQEFFAQLDKSVFYEGI